MKTKTQTKHTPGPWEVKKAQEKQLCIVQKNPYKFIAHIWRGNEQDEFDALLIAAAPELLEAAKLCLKKYVEFLEEHNEWNGEHVENSCWDKLSNSIAKAERK